MRIVFDGEWLEVPRQDVQVVMERGTDVNFTFPEETVVMIVACKPGRATLSGDTWRGEEKLSTLLRALKDGNPLPERLEEPQSTAEERFSILELDDVSERHSMLELDEEPATERFGRYLEDK